MSTLNYRESVDYHSEEDESSLQISSSLTGSCQSQKSQQMALQELKEECYEMTVQQDALKEKYDLAKSKIYRQHFELQSNLQSMFTKYISNMDTVYETKINLLKTRQKRCEAAYKSLSKTPRGRKNCYDENDPYKHRVTGTVINFNFEQAFDFANDMEFEDIEEIENFNFDMLDMDGIMRELNLLNNNLILDGAWCVEAEAEAEIEKIQIDDGDEGIVNINNNNNSGNINPNIINEQQQHDLNINIANSISSINSINNININLTTPHDTPHDETPLGTPYTNHTVSIQPTPKTRNTVDSYIVYTPEYAALEDGDSNNTNNNRMTFRALKTESTMDRTNIIDTPTTKITKKPGLNRVQSERSATIGHVNGFTGSIGGTGGSRPGFSGVHPALRSFGSGNLYQNQYQHHHNTTTSMMHINMTHRNLLMQSTTDETDEINTDSKEFSSVRSIWEQMARKTKSKNKKEKTVGRKRSFTSN